MSFLRLLSTFVIVGLVALLIPRNATAQERVQLKLPQNDKLGSYHGKVFAKDAAFINDDQHVVVAANEALVVFDVKTGRRLNTVLNRQLDENYGDGGHSLSFIHVVDGGATLLTDPFGAWRTPDLSQALAAHRWMLWESYRLGIPSQPDPKPFFSRQGLSREKLTAQENRLDFVQQLGPDFVFLHNFKSDSDQPTTFRIYQKGDRIDRPRQQIDFKVDHTTLYLVLRERWRPLVGFGVPPFGAKPNAPNAPNSYHDLKECSVLHFTRDAAGVVSVQIENVRESKTQQQRLVNRSWQFQGPLRYHNGPNAGMGVWKSAILTHLVDVEIPADLPTGLPSHNGNLIAVPGGKCELYLPLRRRSRTPVGVRVWNRSLNRWTHSLACGESSCARAIAFSSDDRMLLTAHDIERPGLAIWHLQD